ncbi:HAMP domain-containing sensor histidine kinase [Rhodobacter sp. CZR27]|uniref:sensor histidine kinase n=1 Tax=Rhodobacter sp. CZR27 TaxID=2033869 RepID=UPI000BBF04DA|nr:HAMP domain-containing sensor histidine kinase [Rhodobacter sp. CZR27]
MRSLRRRAILSGIALAALSVGLGGVTLFLFLDALALRQFDEALADRHLQVVAAFDAVGPDAEAMSGLLGVPSYELPHSGRYWQVVGETGTITASTSLLDSVLPVPERVTSRLGVTEAEGPGGQVRIGHRRIDLEDGSEATVMVAEATERLEEERRLVRNGLAAAFGLVALFGLLSAMLQTSAVLRPLSTLRQDIARRWQREEALDPADYPSEVAPVVADINLLIARNRDLLGRTRRQAADLAHALRTPSAILRNELDSLQQAGAPVERAAEALDRIDAQILRSLARIRAANVPVGGTRADVRQSAERLARLFRSMPLSLGKTLEIEVEPDLRIAMDAQDLEEALGNLIENAMKWGRSRVVVRAASDEGRVSVSVEDDGPGLPESAVAEALRAGGRLDTSAAGSGLGLPIAHDLAEAYGGRIELQPSDLGGLRATLSLPRGGPPGLPALGGQP